MTETEIATFRAEENARYAIQSKRLVAALAPWQVFMVENKMTSTQRANVEHALRKTLVAADYFANTEVTVKVDLKVGAEGRKGSPNKTFSGTVEVKPVDPKSWRGASSWFHVGKRGALTGGGYECGLGGGKFEF